MVRRPPPLRHAQAHLRTRHSQHPATRIHLVCGPSRSFLGAKKSAGRFHWVMGSFWRGGRGGVGGELKALFGGTGGPGAEQGGGVVDVLVYGLSCLGFWVRSSRLGRICGTRCGGGDQGAVVLHASLPAPGPLTDAAAIRGVHHPAPTSRRSGAGGQEFY